MDNKFFLVVVLVILSVMTIVVFIPLATAPNTPGPNYKNVTVWTHVNITNSRPEVINVTVYDSTNASMRNITINAGSLKDVTCNISIRDWNGYSDVTSRNQVNATLWHITTSTFDSLDDNNTHYTNPNCTDSGNGAGIYVNYLCNFTVLYYANNGTWRCHATVMDMANTTGEGNGTTVFYPVYALNVTDGIDYGNMAVEEYSNNITANITNFGNMAINITVQTYGARINDNLAMNCSLGGNITAGNQRFSSSDVDWGSKIAMTGGIQSIPNLTMPKQTDPSTYIVNTTYWQLYADATNVPGGNCTGYVVFTATAS